MKILIAFLLLIVAVSVSATSQPQQKAWEYKFEYRCDEKKANTAAADGWELADMSMASYGSIGVATCVFKRPK
jgi:hypothetical protein